MLQDEKQRIGDYEVLGVLGAGGMGRVYKVRHTISDRIEALKVLLPDLAGRQELADRFLREIKLVASLNHPNIASLCTAMTIDNQLIMVMEYVDGCTISELLEQGALPIPNALDYLDQVLAALSYAHSKGIVHRDIKPANMMLTPAGAVKLMDFGIARVGTERALTLTGTTLGSVDYMSPEQILGKHVDLRTDLYSVGVSLYEMVTGQRPFRATSDFELMAAHVKELPKSPIEIKGWLPASLNGIIMRSIAKAPEDRFQSAQEFRQALSMVDASSTAQQRSATLVERPGFMDVPQIPAQQSRFTEQSRFPDRPATMVEAPGAAYRPATIVESRPQTMVLRESQGGRGMTQVSGAAPVYAPVNGQIVARKNGFAASKALKLGGGAVLAICVIGVPAALIARHESANSGSTSKASVAPPSPVPPQPAGATSGAAPPVVAGPPRNSTAPRPAPAAPAAAAGLRGQPPRNVAAAHAPPAPTVGAAANVSVAAAAPAPTAPAAPAPLSADAKAKLDELEPRVDQLEARAASVNNSLNTMQKSMQHDGLSLRVDIASKQASMNINLGKTKQAFAQHDPDRTGRFAALTEADLSQLEAFLGR